MVLLNEPVQNALFCLMDRYRTVCVWFMARNCRFPKVGTHGCQRGNHRFPLQGAQAKPQLSRSSEMTAGTPLKRRKLDGKQPCENALEAWTKVFDMVDPLLNRVGKRVIRDSQNMLFCLMDRYRNVCVWFMARNCRFPKVGTHGCQRGNHRLPLRVGTPGSQPGNQRLPLQATAGSHLGTTGYHCKEFPVPKGWN